MQGDAVNWTITGGVASGSAAEGSIYSDSFTTVAGKTYVISFEITNWVGGQVYVSQSEDNSTANYVQGNGVYSKTFVAGDTSTYVNLRARPSAPFTGDVDNISVREISPLSVSIQMDGRMTYADDGIDQSASMYYWFLDSNNRMRLSIQDYQSSYGMPFVLQISSGVSDGVFGTSGTLPADGINIPFNMASRHGSTFVNGAVDGIALTANTTPTALPDLSSTDLYLGYDYMGTIRTFRVWDKDLGDTGIAAATAPSLEPTLSLSFDETQASYTNKNWSV
jgi:hypothetical protein